MEIKREVNIKDNGSYEKRVTITTTKEDGWNDIDVVLPQKHKEKSIYFKGKAKSFSYETDDPRVTRPIVIIAYSSMIIIGFLLSVLGIIINHPVVYFMGIFGFIMVIIGIFGLINGLKTIKEIEKKHQEEKKSQDGI